LGKRRARVKRDGAGGVEDGAIYVCNTGEEGALGWEIMTVAERENRREREGEDIKPVRTRRKHTCAQNYYNIQNFSALGGGLV
jgi:hypothetical protein